MIRCILKAKKSAPLERRHPWVFSGAIENKSRMIKMELFTMRTILLNHLYSKLKKSEHRQSFSMEVKIEQYLEIKGGNILEACNNQVILL